eukprot:scaffold18105_cov60-Phaeocystis_antarctica.AAC.1
MSRCVAPGRLCCKWSTNSRRISSSRGEISRACSLRISCSCRSWAVADESVVTLLIAAARAPIAALLLCSGNPLTVPQNGHEMRSACHM